MISKIPELRYGQGVFLACVFFLISCTPTPGDETAETQRPPNIVIIFTDDQGFNDVGCYGAEGFETPNLDRMASEGVRLTDFHAAQPVCSASRAGLLTGCYPNRIGIHNALGPNAPVGLNQEEITIAEMLKPLGYQSAIYGKWHLGDHPDFRPRKHGFDDYFGILYSNDMWPYHPWQGSVFDFGPLMLYDNDTVLDTLKDQSMLTTQITERAVSFIEAQKDTSFFLYVAHPQPHVPLFVSEKFKGKSEKGLYGDVMMEIDWSVGQILEAIKENGLDENTLVLFTSDNGPWLSYGTHAGSAYPLREGKGTSWEGGVREPFIARWPGQLPAGKVIDVPLMNIDILPTIAAVTGAPLPPRKIDGKNAWSVLTGESLESPQEAYFFYYHVNQLQAVREGDWKLYFPHRYRTLGGKRVGTDGTPVPYQHVTITEPELYDLSTDSVESENVAAQYPEIVARLQALGDEMRRELGDQLTDVEGLENRTPGTVK